MLKLVVLCCLVVVTLAGTSRNLPPRLDGRIVGGTQTTIEAYPYQVSVQMSGYHSCGGSIIGNSTVLTAAHCVQEDKKYYSIRAGSTYHNYGTVYKVKSIIVHPQYNSQTVDYDFAVIKIDGYFPNSEEVAISLECGSVSVGAMAVVTGWGAVQENGGSSSVLQRVSVPIVSQTNCSANYSSVSPITDRMICAGYSEGGHDACQGDSGGPLALNNKLVGIVSWGYGCARPNYPGVYSRVSNQCAWIRKNSSTKQAVIMNIIILLSIAILSFCVPSSAFSP